MANTPQKSDQMQGKYHRRSIRIKDHDYTSEGAYFVTIVTHHRDCLFGEIENGVMRLSDLGKVADEYWRDIPNHFSNVDLGAYVVMPNHVHGIVVIRADNESAPIDVGRGAAMLRPYADVGTDNPHKINVKPGSLGAIVRSYKSAVSYRIHKELNATGIWQRNYYEHIIRNDKDLQRITDYIEMNPSRWNDDDENPHNHA